MRFNEINKLIAESKKKKSSKATQFNSEVGMLAAMCGVDPATFDPNNPAPSFENSQYTVGPETLANIQSQAEHYKPDVFKIWVTKVGPTIAHKVLDQLAILKLPAPTELSWVASQNQSSVADVKFVNHPMDGISIKEKGAPTLANLTAKALGLDTGPEGDPDVFRHYAKQEWDDVKGYVFDKVLELAKRQPDKPWSVDAKYSITYISGDVPADSTRLKMSKPPVKKVVPPTKVPAQTIQPPASTTPTVDNAPVAENAVQPPVPATTGGTGYFKIAYGADSISDTEENIKQKISVNVKWQRVFGDYFQSFWKKDHKLTELGEKLFSKIGADFVSKIKEGLADQSSLEGAVKMGDVSYFYGTPTGVYYVPSSTNNKGLVLQDLKYTSPKGTNQNFLATIGYPNANPATVTIYIRYANGIFYSNPTVRVQKLTNPQGLGWVKL